MEEKEGVIDEIEPPPANGWGFQVRRIIVFTVISLLYALVFFQRTCPSIVSSEMAEDYGVQTADLGIFSSIFFYPYGIIQPFAGLLSDVLEPAYLIGGAQIVASLGAFICGFSKSLTVGCIGRFLVGLGCGPTYVPVTRCLANWFPLEYLSIAVGALLAVGGVGGIIAQGPLAILAHEIGWRNSFYGVGGIGILLSLICIIFVRGNPVAYNYLPVNKDLSTNAADIPCKEKLWTLWENFLKVVSYPFFWLVVVHCVFLNGPFFDVSGMWAGPWLQHIIGYDKQKAANTQIFISVGLIVGSIVLPPVSTFLKTRKWVLVGSSFISLIPCLIFYFMENISYALLCAMLLIFGAFTNSMTSVEYPLVREYYHPAVAGTAVGCANIFTFLSSAIYQTVSSKLIAADGQDDQGRYSARGYKNGLWLFCGISVALAGLTIIFTKDTKFATKEKSEGEEEEEPEGPLPEQTGSDLGEL